MIKKFFYLIVICTIAALCGVIWIFASLPQTDNLAMENPGITALMEQRVKEAELAGKRFRIKQKWVRFQTIPDLLKKAIRISEDANFYGHEGIDYDELKESIKRNWREGEIVRGASTISQQLAKNLFLSTKKSFLRKFREYFITQRLEESLSKNRIFHIYLNIIEFGPGIFGVESAAQFYFKKPASQLSVEEIVRLTAIIPRPLSRRADGESNWLHWRCCWILRKLKLYKYITPEQYLALAPKFC